MVCSCGKSCKSSYPCVQLSVRVTGNKTVSPQERALQEDYGYEEEEETYDELPEDEMRYHTFPDVILHGTESELGRMVSNCN